MDELMNNKDFRDKVTRLAPEVKRYFLDAITDLYEQESELIIDLIEDCRYDLQQTAFDYEDDAEQLRAESRMLEKRRTDYLDHGRKSRNDSRLSYIDERTRSEEYIRRRNRRKKIACSDDSRTESSLSVPEYSTRRTPSPSARTTRSLTTSPAPKTIQEEFLTSNKIQEETQKIMNNMNNVDARIERERERQLQRLEARRRQQRREQQQRHADRTVRAYELLEEAVKMNELLNKDRERQEQKMKEKLETARKKVKDSSDMKEQDPNKSVEQSSPEIGSDVYSKSVKNREQEEQTLKEKMYEPDPYENMEKY